jgi:hypothetical protein
MSTASSILRGEYRQVALSIVARAAVAESAVRVVMFGASGVGARVVFAGSFAPVATVMVYNLAHTNRLKCLADSAISSALTAAKSQRGTDVAGATAAAIAAGRSAVRRGGSISVTVLSDGCQAPAASGPNRKLTDLCGKLAHGASPEQILSASRGEFSLGKAHGVNLTMRGVGVGRFAADASSERAKRIVAFWRLACLQARASACAIGSAVL